MNNIENISIEKIINKTDYYTSNTKIKDINKFNIELNSYTNYLIGLCLNNEILFSINKNLLTISLLSKGTLFTKKIEETETIFLKVEFSNNIFNFYFKINESDIWEQIPYTLSDYTKEYNYGIYGVTNSKYISLKLELSKPKEWSSDKNFYMKKDSIEIEDYIYFNHKINNSNRYILYFDTDKDIFISKDEAEPLLYKAGVNKYIILDSNNCIIKFEKIEDNDKFILSNIKLNKVENDFPEIILPLSDIDFSNQVGIGYETIINKTDNRNFSLELLKIEDIIGEDILNKQDIFQIALIKKETEEEQSFYDADSNDTSSVYANNQGGAVYYSPDSMYLLINFLNYNGKFRTHTIDLSEEDVFGPNDRYAKWFFDIQKDKVTLNIKTYDYIKTEGFILNNNIWKKEITEAEYNKYKNILSIAINNKEYNINIKENNGYWIESYEFIPNGVAIIKSSEKTIRKELNEEIFLNNNMIARIADLNSSINNNISSVNIDNLFLLNLEDGSKYWNEDDIIERANIYLKFSENNLYCKTVCLNNINPLYPINIYSKIDTKDFRYNQIFSKEKQNTIINKKIIEIKDSEKVFIDKDIIWAKVDAVDNNPIEYYLKDNYIIFNKEEINNNRLVEVKYIKDKTFCINYENEKAFITIANPDPNIIIEYSSDIKEKYILENIDLNPYHTENNNGFIYLSETNYLKYINFNSFKNTLITDGIDEIFVEIELYGENNSLVNNFNITIDNESENEYYKCFLDNKNNSNETQSSKKILRIVSKNYNGEIVEPNRKITVIDTKTGISNSFYFCLKGDNK